MAELRGSRFALGTPLLRILAIGSVMFFAIVTSNLAGTDVVVYYAGGERLNAGHQLYALGPGDREILLWPPYWTVPTLSPPLISVLFRPLALLPLEFVQITWCSLQAVAVGWATWSLLRDRTSALVVIALSLGIGLAMVIGNVNGWLLAGYVVLWRFRDRAWIGMLVALMGAVKVLPFVFLGFLVARRDRRTLAYFAMGCVACLAVGIAGAGADSHVAYLNVLATSEPQPGSLSALTGIRWINAGVLCAGTIAAALLPETWSFRASILAIVLGAPGIGPAASSQLVATLVTRDRPRSPHHGVALAVAAPPREPA